MVPFATVIVVVLGTSLVAFALLALIAPARAHRHLHGYAGSARAHYFEMTCRLIAGTAFILHSPGMRFAGAFYLFGWLILVTTAMLLLLPWQWHQRFSGRVIPFVIRYLPLYALANAGLGAVILYGAASGRGAIR